MFKGVITGWWPATLYHCYGRRAPRDGLGPRSTAANRVRSNSLSGYQRGTVTFLPRGFRRIASRDFLEGSQGVVDRLGVGERPRNIGVEDDDIATTSKTRGVLTANARREVVLVAHRFAVGSVVTFLHSSFFPARLLAAH